VEKQIIDSRAVLGLYMIQLNYHVEAKEAIDPIIDLAISHDYKKRLSQIYTILGAYHWAVEENYPETVKALEKALKISEEVKDIVSLVLASFWFGFALGLNCEFERSASYFQRAVDINVAAKIFGVFQQIKACSHCSYWSMENRSAIRTTNEASIAEESGDIYSKAISYVNHGVSCLEKGYWKRQKTSFERNRIL
jgi:tetratricopeptide (TPR) repeat protein